MDVSPKALRKAVAQTLTEVEAGLSMPNTSEGRATLLLAKIQCLTTLAALNEK